jgi:hypothetical protein
MESAFVKALTRGEYAEAERFLAARITELHREREARLNRPRRFLEAATVSE